MFLHAATNVSDISGELSRTASRKASGGSCLPKAVRKYCPCDKARLDKMPLEDVGVEVGGLPAPNGLDEIGIVLPPCPLKVLNCLPS